MPARLLVFPVDAGRRLDQFLAAATALSRRRARTLIAEGRVAVDGRPVKVQSRPVETAAVVDVVLPAAGLGVPERPQPPAVEIRYRDRHLVVAVKPAGVLSQPSEHQRQGELALDQRLALWLALEEGRRPELHLIHRLDRDAGGLLLFARTKAAAASLSRALREGGIERRYRAVVEGRPVFERCTADGPIARVASGAWRFEVAEGGRPARTEVEVERLGDGWAVVRCRLVTGRTHQVRVHLAHLGHPVVGDRLYGSRPAGAPRLLLHAEELAFRRPGDGRPVTVTAALPEELGRYLDDVPPGGE